MKMKKLIAASKQSLSLVIAGVILTSGAHAAVGDENWLDLSKMENATLYTVADAHLDTQWNWTVRDTINKHLPKTFNNNFALFEKYPDYKFNFEGAFRYKLIKEYYPEQYEQKNYVASGQWNVAGSSWEAGDVNVPSSEELIYTRRC